MSDKIETNRKAKTQAVWNKIANRYKVLKKKNPDASHNGICTHIASESSELLNEPTNRSVQNIDTIVRNMNLYVKQ